MQQRGQKHSGKGHTEKGNLQTKNEENIEKREDGGSSDEIEKKARAEVGELKAGVESLEGALAAVRGLAKEDGGYEAADSGELVGALKEALSGLWIHVQRD
mmetsp:Transcript_58096/g.131632  ORF Transcript_58096/g.131632 Transcript_58096/m.131632 type:complete len:101 (+) Transcript_58096:78-380(+)